ncbi:PDR/VanB family oxidoreductase [Streptomyces sp. NPDC090106]|uniref:PDR/VanB family oxidoreductase n=1 Tax=Streptomyces sp. NPDC090106 TaxID=3365946 RepID=UPI003818A75D
MSRPADRPAPPPLRVLTRHDAADGVVALTLADPAGRPLPAWTPGAHVDLHLGGDVVRQYSLCSDPQDLSHYRIAVLDVPGGRGGSRRVHAALRPGTELPVSAPRNRFPLTEDAADYVLIAGGIGITPLLPMAARLTALGRPWRMLYAGRSRTTMAFLGEPPPQRVTVVAEDESGRPDLAAYLAPHPRATVYACGPAGLLDAVRALHPGPVHTERFTAEPAPAPGDDGIFTVELARTGTEVTVPPGRSILEAVRAAGTPVASSCESGICGTCETKVLAGRPDHRDDLLTPDERACGDTMMICVSRSADARLVLDL